MVFKARKWGEMKGESMEVGQLQRTWFELIKSFFHEVSVHIANINVRLKGPDGIFKLVTGGPDLKA